MHRKKDRHVRLTSIINKLKDIDNFDANDHVTLPDDDIEWLTKTAKETFSNEPMLLHLQAPIKVLGDIHGQYFDLLRFFEIGGQLPHSTYLFLGDYIDRGDNSLETICLLLAYKCKYPNHIFLIRGNHESSLISKRYGFYSELSRYFNAKFWDMFIDVFNWMPIAAIISDRIFCVHGGLSPKLKTITQINDIQRPLDLRDEGMAAELIWSDPGPHHIGWRDSERCAAYTFGLDVALDFLRKNQFDLLLRAHQMTNDGYTFPFSPNKSVMTLFSAPDYCGQFGNKGAIMFIDENLLCKFARVD